MDSLKSDAPFDSTEFLKAFDESLTGIGRRRRAGVLQFLYMWDTSWKKACGKVHASVDRYVKHSLEATAKAPVSRQYHQRTRYVLLDEMAKEVRDPIELRHHILNVFMPARDTTSIAVANALFHLARNPHVWKELRTTALSLGSRPLTFEVLKSLIPFKYVIFGTLRLQGPSGRVLRTALRDTILLVGGGGLNGRFPLFVEKGVIMALNLWTLHHDKEIWGNDANEFNPQRWIDRRPMWEFVPFLGGPHICPAQQQVLTHAVYILVRLVKEFPEIENRDASREYVEFTKMTTESRNGVQIALYPAETLKARTLLVLVSKLSFERRIDDIHNLLS